MVAAAALAAVVVLATQGGASNTAATGFRGVPDGVPGGSAGGAFGGSAGYGVPGTGGGTSATPGNGTADPQRTAQRQAFLACLQKNGVDTSAMTSGRPRLDPSDPTTASAFQACSNLLPQRGAGAGGPGPVDHDGDGDGAGPGMPGTAPGGAGT